MTLKRRLPQGWYPGSGDEVTRLLAEWARRLDAVEKSACAGIVPHAGWSFSGSVAFDVVRRLNRDAQTVLIFGGHLGPREKPLIARGESCETPLGPLEIDEDFVEGMIEEISLDIDPHPDNTVEVQLPLIKHALPNAKVVCMRMPVSPAAIDAGAAAMKVARKLGRNVVAIGSTDLTHYGANYGFEPRGTGEAAERWVRDVNDRRFIDALLAMDNVEALRRASDECSACSAGGAAAAIEFARASGAAHAELVAYRTSLEVVHAQSFVGYAGIVYLA